MRDYGAWQSDDQVVKIGVSKKEFNLLHQKNATHVLQSELYCSISYLERIIFAIKQFSQLNFTPKYKLIEQNANKEIRKLLQDSCLANSLSNDTDVNEEVLLEESLQNTFALTEALINLFPATDQLQRLVVDLINQVYSIAFELHQFSYENSDIQIQLPRMGLIETLAPKNLKKAKDNLIKNDALEDFLQLEKSTDQNQYSLNKDNSEIQQFFLDKEKLNDILACENVEVRALRLKRKSSYKGMLQKGHQFVFIKELDKALASFQKASNFQQTAESLTLTGWVYSLKGEIAEAKAYCLKAIRLDGQYGPAFNDLGSFLLNEGKIEESLKWFEMAKSCNKYQNREYPYINAGRAFMATKQYDKALEEFSKALALAPYHEELHQTIEKLRKSLKINEQKISKKVHDAISTSPNSLNNPPMDDLHI